MDQNQVDVRSIVRDAIEEFVKMERTKSEPAYKTELTEERKRREQLEQRVNEQVSELDRMNKLKGFLSPQIAKLVVTDEKLLESHRRDITAVFCDLRGFTAFAEHAEPEDIITVLQEYYRCLGESIDKFEGTLQHFAGDGLLIIFNDPIPCPDPALRAVRSSNGVPASRSRTASCWDTADGV